MQKSIIIKGVNLNYEDIGTGCILFFLHGFGMHLESLKYSFEGFLKDENIRRIYLDLPGMGKSLFNDEIMNTEDILDIVLVFIELVIKDTEFSLVGESYGGYLARGVLNKYSKQIKGMALVCPVIKANYFDRVLPDHKSFYVDEEYLSTLDKEDIEDLEFLVIKNKYTIDRTIKELFEPMADNEAFLVRIKENGYGFSFDVDKEIGEYLGPTLFLLGKHDSVAGYMDAFNILNHYPNSTYVILDKAGHNLHIEQKELFELHMKTWLECINKAIDKHY
jgi:pimeloyl-ACP methyl ester carboxylesterase